jgi:hypothetical protein
VNRIGPWTPPKKSVYNFFTAEHDTQIRQFPLFLVELKVHAAASFFRELRGIKIMRIKLVTLAIVAISAVALVLTGDSPERASAQGGSSAIIITSSGTAPNGNYSQTSGTFIRVVAGTPTPTPTPGPTPCVPTPGTPGGTIYIGTYSLSNGAQGNFILSVTNGTNAADATGAPDTFPEHPVVVEQGPATVTAQVNTTTGMGAGTISFTSNGTGITGQIAFFARFPFEPTPPKTCTGPTPTPTPNATPTPVASPTPIASPTPTPGQTTVTISGRVTTPTGQGLRNAVVSLTDSFGVRRTATTSSFGIFSFAGVKRNETHIVTVSSKRYRFSPQFLFPQGDITNADFTGLE